MDSSTIIGVQFEKIGKIYFFDSCNYPDIDLDDFVIVTTTRGSQLAKVVQKNINSEKITEEIKCIERKANSKDLLLKQMIKEKEEDALTVARSYLKKSSYEGVKVASAEYSYDGTRLTFYLNAESDPKFNIKNFLDQLSKQIKDARIEVRQIGPRDFAKSLGGMGACGLETRCCSKFLMEFQSISIKMAKSQDISLTPSEITGMCGRLRCCLLYEYEFYEEARKNLPKRKKIVQTPSGQGKVIQVLPLSQSVIVDLPEFGPRQFHINDLIVDNKPSESKNDELLEDDQSDTGEILITPQQIPPEPSNQTNNQKNINKNQNFQKTRRSRKRRR